MYYLRARYFEPASGRFLSRDSFPGYSALLQSLNPYGYGRSNPLRFVDLTGNIPLKPEDAGWTKWLIYNRQGQLIVTMPPRIPDKGFSGLGLSEWEQGVITQWGKDSGAIYSLQAGASLEEVFPRSMSEEELDRNAAAFWDSLLSLIPAYRLHNERLAIVAMAKDPCVSDEELDAAFEQYLSDSAFILAAGMTGGLRGPGLGKAGPTSQFTNKLALEERAARINANRNTKTTYPRDQKTKITQDRWYDFKSEGEARAFGQRKAGERPS